jgi:hypothetical protein
MITEKGNNSNKKRNFIPILIFCTFIFCGNQAKSVVNELNNLKNEHPDTKKKAIFELHEGGKKSIPLLIREISDDTKILCQIQNPKYSFYGEANTYFGVLSAFVIELIIGREKLNTEKSLKSEFLLGSDDTNYVYTKGVIIDDENKRSIKEGDLIKIREIYEAWWEKNKSKSIEQLRNDWRNNIRPLSGSKYHWE